MSRRALRKLVNALALALSGVATAIGLFFLGAILWTLLRNGLAGMSLQRQSAYRALRAELATIDAQAQKLTASEAEHGPASDWRDLGQSLFNLKEFIYVR